MSLLNQEDMDRVLAAVRIRRGRRHEVLGRALYGAAGERTPVGYVHLRTPEDRELWAQHIRRQALAESEGRSPEQVATAMLDEVNDASG